MRVRQILEKGKSFEQFVEIIDCEWPNIVYNKTAVSYVEIGRNAGDLVMMLDPKVREYATLGRVTNTYAGVKEILQQGLIERTIE